NPAGGCRHARALGNGLDAQPGADGSCLVPGQEPVDSLAGGDPVVLGHARRCGPRQQHSQLAVGCGLRSGCCTLLQGLQSGASGTPLRSQTYLHRQVGAPARVWTTCRGSEEDPRGGTRCVCRHARQPMSSAWDELTKVVPDAAGVLRVTVRLLGALAIGTVIG